jgi:EAL domain-containing protein (putative c-di-GMP-specific phosphodiesterase class I)
MDVTAEGIETAEQLALLREIGVDSGQGFFLARPAPADEIVELLREDPTW